MTGAKEEAQNVSKDKMSDYQKRSTQYSASENMAAWVRVKERGNEGGRERGEIGREREWGSEQECLLVNF